MLSRTADHLYWMARYIERAENIARMLDVNYRMSMVPEGDAGWGATLSINGLEQAFRAKHDEATAEGTSAGRPGCPRSSGCRERARPRRACG